MEESLFWADQLAKKITGRKKYMHIDKDVPKLDRFVIKSAASVSGVLHIGRLSDTIRCDSAYRALKDLGVKAEFIWVADNMDPLRKVPAGVPAKFKEYIGMPIPAIPDPEGCHKSYNDHFLEGYLQVVNEFIHEKMKVYQMSEEYKKGTFAPYIKKLIENRSKIIEIQNKFRKEPLGKDYCPWKPICESCGKIITPVITKVESGKVHYTCKDYQFEKTVATGCGHEGVNDPAKGQGKVLYKGELAMQHTHWKVSAEGFGKEYQVPGSAYWINTHIQELILDFPATFAIFYEHLLIDGTKMSASLGNVVYPQDWLCVAPAELLRFYYNKKLMKTRSFSFKDLPRLFDEYDTHKKVYFDEIAVENKKEKEHMRRLFEISQLDKPENTPSVPFEHMVTVVATYPSDEEAIAALMKSGHVKKLTRHGEHDLKKRFNYARTWAKKWGAHAAISIGEAADKKALAALSDGQKNALRSLSSNLKDGMNEQELMELFKQAAASSGISAREFFQAAYTVLTGKPQGPKLANIMMTAGAKKIKKLFGGI